MAKANLFHECVDQREGLCRLRDDTEPRVEGQRGNFFFGEDDIGAGKVAGEAADFDVIGLADDIVARLEGKSSLGRIGLLIHSTAGFIDPGFTGQVTLELSNVANLPIAIYPGMKIGQISFMRLDRSAERPYGHHELKSKYQDQRGPVASQYERNYR